MACTMSQFPYSFTDLVPPMTGASQQEFSAPSPIPWSPSSSQGEQRVSKAKKGKRVHVCEYPGCEKVFTRAEHRRRHELSHKSRKLYVCPEEGCIKTYHRADYLAQHMIRHEPDLVPRSSSVRSHRSVSSPVPGQSTSHSIQAKSPVPNQFRPPVASPSLPVPDTDRPIAGGDQYWASQHTQEYQPSEYSYNYPGSMGQVPGSPRLGLSEPPTTTTLPVPSTELDAYIDRYMRSVLRPEAFITPHEPHEQTQPSFWASNVDQNLPQMHPSAFQPPTSYPMWHVTSGSVPQQIHETPTPPQPESHIEHSGYV